MDRAAAERAIADFLRALGRDPARDPELALTPKRVAEAFADELLIGYATDLEALLHDGSPPARQSAGIVVVREIAVATVCPHHLLSSLGRATVAYRPGARVLGLGTIARLVDACSRRLALQEQIGEMVVDSAQKDPVADLGMAGAGLDLGAHGRRSVELVGRAVGSRHRVHLRSCRDRSGRREALGACGRGRIPGPRRAAAGISAR